MGVWCNVSASAMRVRAKARAGLGVWASWTITRSRLVSVSSAVVSSPSWSRKRPWPAKVTGWSCSRRMRAWSRVVGSLRISKAPSLKMLQFW